MGRKNGLKASLGRHLAVAQRREDEHKKALGRAAAADARKAAARARQAHQVRAPWVPFSSGDTVLLLGEGDFSFGSAILASGLADSVVATALDAREDVVAKYPAAAEHLEYLEADERASGVLFGVDATELQKNKVLLRLMHDAEAAGADPVVVFNFPHLGASIADQDRNILAHQKLLLGVFASASALSPRARLAVTLFDGEPYESWEIKKRAGETGWALVRSGAFEWGAYPGYAHCLTLKQGQTHRAQAERRARTYLFKQRDGAEDADADQDEESAKKPTHSGTTSKGQSKHSADAARGGKGGAARGGGSSGAARGGKGGVRAGRGS